MPGDGAVTNVSAKRRGCASRIARSASHSRRDRVGAERAHRADRLRRAHQAHAVARELRRLQRAGTPGRPRGRASAGAATLPPKPVMRCCTWVKKLSRACSPSLPTSMPTSSWCATRVACRLGGGARELGRRRPARRGSGARTASTSASGRGRLPACVVRMRRSLCNIRRESTTARRRAAGTRARSSRAATPRARRSPCPPSPRPPRRARAGRPSAPRERAAHLLELAPAELVALGQHRARVDPLARAATRPARAPRPARRGARRPAPAPRAATRARSPRYESTSGANARRSCLLIAA